jgi:DNA-binding LacI/PurR family transcriptional regulator
VEFSFEQRFFLLFDELNSFKEDIYTSFLEAMNNKAQIDIFFHHFNLEMFKKLINESNGNYSKYIIMPTNLVGAASIIKTLPKPDVYVLDQTNSDLTDYPSVHQNFIKDMYNALVEAKLLLNKYQKMVLIFPGFREPLGMKIGFEKFCSDFAIPFEIIPEFVNREIEHREVYVIPDDRDLVKVIEQSKIQSLQLGSDYGIISYNETPLKKVVENGITTISTDLKAMGTILANMILENKKEQIENENRLILRKSL